MLRVGGVLKGVAMPNERIITLDSFKEWGRIGGAKVRGDKKKRSKAHYERLSKLGLAARLAKRAKLAATP